MGWDTHIDIKNEVSDNAIVKNIFKAFFIDLIIIIISLLLYYIGVLYSDDYSGFHTLELLSSGGYDDFQLFMFITFINIFGFLFGIVALVINIILYTSKYKIVNISSCIYQIIFLIQFLLLMLLNTSTSLITQYLIGDLFSLWLTIYIMGIIIVVVSPRLIKKAGINFEYNNLKWFYKIIIALIFIFMVYLCYKIEFLNKLISIFLRSHAECQAPI